MIWIKLIVIEDEIVWFLECVNVMNELIYEENCFFVLLMGIICFFYVYILRVKVKDIVCLFYCMDYGGKKIDL